MNMINDREEAQDLVQITFLKAWKGISNFKGESASVFTWLFRISKNVVYDFLRKKKTRYVENHFEIQEESLNDHMISSALTSLKPVDPPDVLAENNEIIEKVIEAVNELPSLHQDIFDLRIVQGLRYQEIAELQEIQLGTVMSRVFYTREKLRDKLSEKGISVTG
jgi:RNA polymerase sigma-70 factor, ECF subfamily